MKLVRLAKQSYGDFVPYCEPSGAGGDVHAYMRDLVPAPRSAACGISSLLVIWNSVSIELWRTLPSMSVATFLVDEFVDYGLFRFFAAAWISRPVDRPSNDLLDEYHDILDKISNVHSLPEKLQAKVAEVRQGLPRLFRSRYPMVI